ncbi:MAG: lipocalin family protein [Bacteroidota bacterium]
MKYLMNTVKAIFFFAVAISLTSCNPERIAARNLEGDWDAKSYTIDGEELIGFLVSSFDMEFEEYDGEEGDFELRVFYANGTSENFTGEYSLNTDGDELDLKYSDGTTEEWDLTLEDDDLELESNFNGSLYIIKAERD